MPQIWIYCKNRRGQRQGHNQDQLPGQGGNFRRLMEDGGDGSPQRQHGSPNTAAITGVQQVMARAF